MFKKMWHYYALTIVLLLGISTYALSASTVQTGIGGKLSYAYDTVTGYVRMMTSTTIDTLLSCEDQTNNLCMVSGGVVRQQTVTSGVTTNTTSTAVAGYTGTKTVYGEVVGTGAVTQTQELFCDVDSDAANGKSLGILTLSGTTRDQAYFTFTASCSWLYVTTTNTTGTGATGAVYVMD